MATFRIDPYKGWTEAQLRTRCIQLVRANLNKDMLICMLVDQARNGAEIPEYFEKQIEKIFAAYCDEDEQQERTADK